MHVKENLGPADFERLVDEQNATASRLIFTDQSIFELEQEKLFAKAWLYIGHESEIPNEGDYVTRQMATDPVILSRSKHGKINVLLNSCSHRGTLLCTTDVGTTKGFTCAYHGWVFDLDGALVATADDPELYAGKVDFKTLDIKTAARVDTYAGLVFATWDKAAPDLGDYLGDARWYLDLYHNRTPQGMEVLGAPHRWVVDTNWKIGAVNFGADGPHAVKVHGPVTAATFGATAQMLREALLTSPSVSMGNGHNGILPLIPDSLRQQIPPYPGYPPDLIELYEQCLNPGQQEISRGLIGGVQTIFPNFSSVQLPATFHPDQPPINMMAIRLWQPISSSQMEIWNWFLVEKEASDEWKEKSMKIGVQTFSAGGTFDQDDAEAWSCITHGITGNQGNRGEMNFQMALAFRDQTVANFPGPGRAYPSIYGEVTEFDVLLEWQKYMCA